MASVAVQIANIALNNLGDKTISAFSDKSAQAFATKDRLQDIINSVLRAHPWNCMTKRDTLPQLGTTPKYKFDYAYSLPTDSLRVLSLKEEEDYDYEWKIEIVHHDNQDLLALVTNATSANIRYVKRYSGNQNHDNDSNTLSLFDPLLIQACGMALAGEVAMDLTGQSQLRDLMLGKYQTLLSEARSINGQEGTADKIESNEWIESRTKSSSGWFKPFSASTASGVT
tara:strand:+ start:3143 stop:3823 length:681 start_codon:yes stop_codon:yes gene_type:complete